MINRRTLLAAAAAAGAAPRLGMPLIGRARAAEFSYKFASDLPATHPINTRMQEAADQIKEDTGGKLEIKLFPNSQLGGDPDMFSQLRSGALEFFTLSGANALSSLVPKASISGVGFAFSGYHEVFQAMDGDLGAYVRSLIRAAGMMVLDKIWDNGFRQITSSTKPIVEPADLHGMKIRVPPGRLWVSLFQSLGASPTAISFNETYSALQTNIVEGQENALAVTDVAKLYEVQKYCSLTNHMWDGFWFLINGRAWRQLPPAIQESVANRVNAAALLQRQDVAKLNASLQTALEGKGLKFNAVDPAPFRAELKKAGFYTDWQHTFGDEEWALLEKVTGPL
jgi:tripartite ATP-independent transporter DctP family solute receptor